MGNSGIFILLPILLYCFGYVSGLTPIVIVPGIGGSQLEAKLQRNTTRHYWCYTQTKQWFTIWLSIEELLPLARFCWIDNIKLVYDEELGKMKTTPGVDVRVPGFGNTSGIEWLDPSLHGPGIYFYPLVQVLTNNLGYIRGKTLRSAPYDFRYDPTSAHDYFKQLKLLIEDTYKINGNKKILLTSHSMGAPYTLYFFKNQTQAWKDKYLKAWVTISGAFAGSVKAILAYISGDGFGIPKYLDNPFYLRAFQRTFSSLAYLLPDSRLWGDKEVLVKTYNRTYTVKDYDDLFDDIEFPLGKNIRRYVPPPWQTDAPQVKMYCFHGRNLDTPGSLIYPRGYFPDYIPDIDFVNGDGTVPLRSLQACLRWKKDQNHEIIHQEFPYAEHNGILQDEYFLKAFIDILKEE